MLKRLLIPPLMYLVLVACGQSDGPSLEMSQKSGSESVVLENATILPTPTPVEITTNSNSPPTSQTLTAVVATPKPSEKTPS